ncbi:hypothetical protein M406DRAFT_70317 [Cryphonectria parasitica EP155]|uniref:Methyltransferase type 11 domain-containing protein n=1 Tax=Cryphonectria parasitica (strain ATCC 38755 / EP155) TaxID=660469 RepID=A0A9P5CPH8_CRYP1|nr:uncharacterized protein M406DRAFT_70317 [Cryphonectria parasitica EP155]KAF3765186.1 hypothetical protein M406DRAFT_70317 [Cryphonectria parasitica EP155]
MGNYDPELPRTALEDAHEASESGDGRKEVKYPFAFKNLDWDEYHLFRPRYPQSMLEMWLDYHREHGGKFHCLHDVGAGPGTLSMSLHPLFDHVVVSDAGSANVQSAKRSLTSTTVSPKFEFIQSPAETVHASIPPSSVDLVTVGMAFHYFNTPEAIRSIAHMLKPGGTLAAATYGFRLRFPGRPALECLWYRVTSKESLRLLREGRLFPAAVNGMAAAMAGLDSVPLPTELFETGAKRILVNVEGDNDGRPFCFIDEDPKCWQPAPNRVGATDTQSSVRDASWRRAADAAWLKGFLESSQMGFGQQTWGTAEWMQLESMVRSAGGQVMVEWPVAIILATRNDRPVSAVGE